MKITRVECSLVEPKHIDKESSPTTIYINKNIKKYHKDFNIDGNIVEKEVYSYDMYSYTLSEFEFAEQYIVNDEEMARMRKELDKALLRIQDLETTVAILKSKVGE